MPSEKSMIEDLRELETELREKEEYRKANIIDLFIRYSTHCKIEKSKVREKIEEIQKRIEEENNLLELNQISEEDYEARVKYLNYAVNIYKELLGE